MCNILHFLLQTEPLENVEPRPPPMMELAKEEEFAALPSPRLLHTHALPQILPKEMLIKGRKLIMMYRNPKDVAVSMFHHFGKFDGVGSKLSISWNCFVDTWMKGLGEKFEFYNLHAQIHTRTQ